jgi:hypothetical protein
LPSEDSREHLAPDEEPEREIHVRGSNAGERTEDQNRDRAEQHVVAARADRRQEIGHRAT